MLAMIIGNTILFLCIWSTNAYFIDDNHLWREKDHELQDERVLPVDARLGSSDEDASQSNGLKELDKKDDEHIHKYKSSGSKNYELDDAGSAGTTAIEKSKDPFSIKIKIKIDTDTKETKGGKPSVETETQVEENSRSGEHVITESEVNEDYHLAEKIKNENDKVYLQGGDELITEKQRKIEKYDRNPKISRDFVKPVARRWKKSNGRVKVPYKIGENMEGKISTLIKKAIKRYKDLTCIDWVPKTSKDSHYVKFIRDDGCYSYVGKVRFSNRNFQPLSLGYGCEKLGTVEHEMMHTLGFFHEHQRPDRDDYIKVYLQNVKSPERNRKEFAKQPWDIADTLGIPYDTHSIMHYGSHYLAKRKWYWWHYKDTILTKSGDHIKANRKDFSKIDIKQLNIAYKCSQ